MSSREKKLEQSASVRRALRNMGYRDGQAGRPASRPEADYQQGWRRGREAREGRHG